MSKIERNWHQELVKDCKVKEYLNYILSYRQKQLKWYKWHQAKKKIFATVLLGLAVILFGGSLVIPILPDTICEFFTKNAYQWGYVFLLLATVFLLADRLFGNSNGWVRYMLARLSIEEVASEYHGEWLSILPKLEKEPISEEVRNEAIDLLKNFDSKLKKVVEAETENWKSYFSTQLAEFSKKANKIIEDK